MKRILVVYYSRTGHARAVGRAIAGACSADVEEIRDVRPRQGLLGWIRSAVEVVRGKRPPIDPPRHDVSAYDLVILGCPVWASRVASPMRTFLVRHAALLPEIALFCTMGGRGGDRVLRELAALCGKAPVATMALREADLKADKLAPAVTGFIGSFAQGECRVRSTPWR